MEVLEEGNGRGNDIVIVSKNKNVIKEWKSTPRNRNGTLSWDKSFKAKFL